MAAVMEMSKTYQYRKVMKPMLERKRRARINKCLDELKDLMVATLESEGEHVTRLEKADILELTVSHLQKLRQQRLKNFKTNKSSNLAMLSQADGFRSGFIFAANEVSRNLAKIPGVNVTFGTQLMTHLGQRLNQIQPPLMKSQLTTNTEETAIHQPISIQCHNSTGSTNSSPQSLYSAPISPISNYSDSTKEYDSNDNNGLFVKQTNSKSQAFQHHLNYVEENVWRPW